MQSNGWSMTSGTKSAMKSPALPDGKPAVSSRRRPVTRSSHCSPRCWHRCRRSRTVSSRHCVCAWPLSVQCTNPRNPHPLHSTYTCISWSVGYTRSSCIVVALICGCPFAVIIPSHVIDTRERGMKIQIWNGADPLSVSMFNCNYSQTRHVHAVRCCVASTHRSHGWHVMSV